MNRTNKLLSLFFISIAGIAFELYVMRIFSVGGWSNFGSLVISTALLGIGLSGIILTFLSAWVKENADGIMAVCSIALPLTMALAVIAAQLVPFNPVFLGVDPRQVWFIGAYYIIYGIPFFVIATFIGVAFISMNDQVQKLYFWNMIGSGIGGFFIIFFMFLLPPRLLILPILGLTTGGALFASITKEEGSPKAGFKIVPLASLVLSAVISFALAFLWGDIRVSDYKAISYVRKYPDAKLVHHSFGPGGEYHVYASKYFHFAPGLSDNASIKIPNMPNQPYWGLYVDGSGPIGIMGALRSDEQAYMDYLPMAAPYLMLADPDVLLVNLSGGINAQIAKYKGAKKIDIVEPSAEMISLMRKDPNITRFTGNLLDQKGITVIEGDPRSHCAANKASYDLIEISLVDSIGLSDSGGYPIFEDYKYTVEAFQEYIASLKKDGVLSITIWDRLTPPRNVLKILNTAILAMKGARFKNPEKNLYSFGLFMSTSTILIKNGEFSEGEMYDLNNFVKTRSFEVLYSPDSREQPRELAGLLDTYKRHFSGLASGQIESFTNADMYRAAIPAMFRGEHKNLEQNYVFDIRPIRDSRPYYSGFLKLDRLPMYMDQLEDVSEEWGYLLLLGILLQACLFGLLIIFIPVAGRWKTLFKNRKGTGGVIVYFASLGLSYMLIELFLIQRLGIFLSNPTYATSIVITVMLTFSAVGNLVSSLYKKYRQWIVAGACALIVAGLLFYIFGLDGLLAGFRSSSLFVRVLVAGGIIAPVAFFMGIPYPNGLDSLQENKPNLLPWAWGMNGGLSLAGAAMARIISVAQGFPYLLGLGMILYIAIGLLFRVNLQKDTPIAVEAAETET